MRPAFLQIKAVVGSNNHGTGHTRDVHLPVLEVEDEVNVLEVLLVAVAVDLGTQLMQLPVAYLGLELHVARLRKNCLCSMGSISSLF